MTTADFIDLIRQMRDAQKAYFSERSKKQMSIAMELERRVDAELARMKDGQKELFELLVSINEQN